MALKAQKPAILQPSFTPEEAIKQFERWTLTEKIPKGCRQITDSKSGIRGCSQSTESFGVANPECIVICKPSSHHASTADSLEYTYYLQTIVANYQLTIS